MNTVLKARITEKSYSFISEDKKAASRYTFTAPITVTKGMAKKMVEAEHNVHVTSINVVRIPAKERRFRGHRGFLSAFKKFVVTLKPGEHITSFNIEEQQS